MSLFVRHRRGGLVCALLFAGCFNGADALNLPCEQDEDCGRGQSCIASPDPAQKFCDGPPDSFSGGASSTGMVPTSSGSTGATSSDGSTGDPIPSCEGRPDPEKECDPGDPGPMGGDLGDCTSACRFPEFIDRFDGPVPLWSFGVPAVFPNPFAASLTEGPAPWAIDTGTQQLRLSESHPVDTNDTANGGVAMAVSDPIPLPELPEGTHYELSLEHRFIADVPECFESGSEYLTDGGLVGVWVEGDGEFATFFDMQTDGTILPFIAEDATTSNCDTLMLDGNPLVGEQAFVGIDEDPTVGDGKKPIAFRLPQEAAGRSVRVVFLMSYDCAHCWSSEPAPPGPGWWVDDVVVSALAG